MNSRNSMIVRLCSAGKAFTVVVSLTKISSSLNPLKCWPSLTMQTRTGAMSRSIILNSKTPDRQFPQAELYGSSVPERLMACLQIGSVKMSSQVLVNGQVLRTLVHNAVLFFLQQLLQKPKPMLAMCLTRSPLLMWSTNRPCSKRP